MGFFEMLKIIGIGWEPNIAIFAVSVVTSVAKVCSHVCQKSVWAAAPITAYLALHELAVCRIDGDMMSHYVIHIGKLCAK